MLVQLSWYSNLYFSRYGSSRFSHKFSFTRDFSENPKNFWISEILFHMKEKEIIRSMISLSWMFYYYFPRYGYSKFSLNLEVWWFLKPGPKFFEFLSFSDLMSFDRDEYTQSDHELRFIWSHLVLGIFSLSCFLLHHLDPIPTLIYQKISLNFYEVFIFQNCIIYERETSHSHVGSTCMAVWSIFLEIRFSKVGVKIFLESHAERKSRKIQNFLIFPNSMPFDRDELQSNG